jgi:hypothetical protein
MLGKENCAKETVAVKETTTSIFRPEEIKTKTREELRKEKEEEKEKEKERKEREIEDKKKRENAITRLGNKVADIIFKD